MSFSKRLLKVLAFALVASLLWCDAGYVFYAAEPAYAAAKKKSAKKKISKSSASKSSQYNPLINVARNKYWEKNYPASVGYRSVGQQLEKALVNPLWSLEKGEGGHYYPVFTGIARYQGRRAIYKVCFSANIEAMSITGIYVNDRMIYNSVSAALAPMLGFGTTSSVLNDFLDAIYSGE